MSLLEIKNYPKIKTKPSTGALGEVVPISWWQVAEEVDLVCICCAYRWREPVALSMMAKPQWMGDLVCPAQDCGAEGFVVRG
jgi:hypothetical protein